LRQTNDACYCPHQIRADDTRTCAGGYGWSRCSCDDRYRGNFFMTSHAGMKLHIKAGLLTANFNTGSQSPKTPPNPPSLPSIIALTPNPVQTTPPSIKCDFGLPLFACHSERFVHSRGTACIRSSRKSTHSEPIHSPETQSSGISLIVIT
jgi:hypothetical protein